jgi:aminoglycoside 3-N-acetyltransferase
LPEQLIALGVQPGGVLLVHSAFSKVGAPDGPAGLIGALLAVLGPHGTLVMPSMCDDADVPFDRAGSPCRALGIVADTFWRMPGVLRSDNPHAARITAPHPIDIPHGMDSPPGRLYELKSINSGSGP